MKKYYDSYEMKNHWCNDFFTIKAIFPFLSKMEITYHEKFDDMIDTYFSYVSTKNNMDIQIDICFSMYMNGKFEIYLYVEIYPTFESIPHSILNEEDLKNYMSTIQNEIEYNKTVANLNIKANHLLEIEWIECGYGDVEFMDKLKEIKNSLIYWREHVKKEFKLDPLN